MTKASMTSWIIWRMICILMPFALVRWIQHQTSTMDTTSKITLTLVHVMDQWTILRSSLLLCTKRVYVLVSWFIAFLLRLLYIYLIWDLYYSAEQHRFCTNCFPATYPFIVIVVIYKCRPIKKHEWADPTILHNTCNQCFMSVKVVSVSVWCDHR